MTGLIGFEIDCYRPQVKSATISYNFHVLVCLLGDIINQAGLRLVAIFISRNVYLCPLYLYVCGTAWLVRKSGLHC